MDEPAARTGSSGSAVRPDIANRALIRLLAAITILVGAVLTVWWAVAPEWRQPGTPALQSCAIAGSFLLLAPALFSVVKRGGLTTSPPAWFVVHVLASMLGTLLVFVHAAGRLSGPAVLLLLLVAFLVAQGVWARVALAKPMAQVFATRLQGFSMPHETRRATLRRLIEAKSALLPRLEPGAQEATFSPILRHWLRHPVLASRYASLAGKETRLIGARGTVSPALAWSRRVHVAAAALFVCGLLVHVVLTTFFAGYVADGRDIYWWHVTAWGGAR